MGTRSQVHFPLTQEYIVDSYKRIETQRLRYIASKNSQKKIRAEMYSGMMHAAQNESLTSQVGKRIILPLSVVGSPCYQ